MSGNARLAGVVGMLLLGAACSSPTLRIPFISKPGLQVQWSEALRRQGVEPIFPLREDVQVGDIYASRMPLGEVGARGDVPLDLFLARVDLTEEINRFYASRFLFPETRAFAEGGGGADRSSFGDGGGLGGDRRMMRLVAFPALATVNVTRKLSDAELFQFLPPEALAFLQKSGSWSRVRALTIGTTMAESYGLPAEEACSRFAKAYGESDELAKLVLGGMGTSRPTSRGFLGMGKKSTPGLNVFVHLITEVYTVRSLDIVLRTDLNTSLVDGYGGFMTGQGLNLERMNKLLQQNGQASQGGGQVRFVSFGSEGVALRRTFARPLVMGYRGVVIRVNALDRSAELHGIIESRRPAK